MEYNLNHERLSIIFGEKGVELYGIYNRGAEQRWKVTVGLHIRCRYIEMVGKGI